MYKPSPLKVKKLGQGVGLLGGEGTSQDSILNQTRILMKLMNEKKMKFKKFKNLVAQAGDLIMEKENCS